MRQDAQLERIERGIGTLGDMAMGMKEELDKQNPVIDDIDTQLNKVTGQLKSNNAKLKGLITQVGWVGVHTCVLVRVAVSVVLGTGALNCIVLCVCAALCAVRERLCCRWLCSHSHNTDSVTGSLNTPLPAALLTADAVAAQLLHRHRAGVHPAGHRRLHLHASDEEKAVARRARGWGDWPWP